MIFMTNRPSLLGRVILGVAALNLLSFVQADFAQCLAGWEWSYNSQGQNPCEIAGALQAPCLGYSVYVLGPLSPGTNYITPQKNDTTAKSCGCNTIIYSLYAACSSCQFNSSYSPVTWTFWQQFCDSVYVSQYPDPIPFNTSVPHWAYVNDTVDPGFNSVLAQAAGRDPEVTPTSPPTISLSSPTSSSQSSSNTNPGVTPSGTKTSLNPSTTTSAVGGGGNKTHTGAIAGGVVGGIVALGLIGALAFFILKKRRGSGKDILGPMGYNDNNIYEAPKIYNPADPSTYPSLPSGPGSSNSGGYTTNPYQTGRYNGAAEL